MLIVAVRSVGAIGVDAAVGPEEVCGWVVDEIAGPVLAAAVEFVKWIVINAGPFWSVVRLTVIGTAGL